MDRQEYFAKLSDPRWQKLRLKIMERDNFTCQRCGDQSTTLNVHHCYYKWGMDPWLYPESSLVTLCEICHEPERDLIKPAKADLTDVLSQAGFTSVEFEELALILRQRLLRDHDCPQYVARIFIRLVNDRDLWAEAIHRFFDNGAAHRDSDPVLNK